MRRPFRWMIAFVAWTFIAVGPAQAAGPGTTTDGLTSVTGVLQVLHADDFVHGTARFVYALRSASGWLDLDFPQAGPMDEGGATVQVTGRFAGGRLEIATDAPDHGFRIIRKAKPLYQTSGQTFHHDSNGVDVPDDPGDGRRAGDAADPQLLPDRRRDRRRRDAGDGRRRPAELLERRDPARTARRRRTGSCSATPTASRTSSPRSRAARSR